MAITSRDAKVSYERWVNRGVTCRSCALCINLFNYAISMEYTTFNPYKTVKRRLPRKEKWFGHKKMSKKCLLCYGDFKYRSIGLIVQMAYEWCQRIGDMRVLKWENGLAEDMYLEQSKRRSVVFLPIRRTDCHAERTERRFWLSTLCVSQNKACTGRMQAHGMYEVGMLARRVMRRIGLSDELRLMDLRRTGIEMVDAGVDISQIMSVTGHTNIGSVQPYIKYIHKCK